MALIYLIRHPHTQPDPAVPASRWGLSAAGEAQVRAVAALPIWERAAAIYTSREYKAAVLGQAITAAQPVPWTQVDDLRESSREAWVRVEAFEAAQRAYFARPTVAPVPGWETAQTARDRFVTAMDAILHTHHLDETIAVVSHATVLTLYTAYLRDEPPAFDAWRAIGFAAIMAVDRVTLRPITAFLDPPYDTLPQP